MRQYGTANEGYAHLAVELLSTCVQAVNSVRDHLENGHSILVDDDGREVVSRYVHLFMEISSCLRQLVSFWEAYLDGVNAEDTAYWAPLVHLPVRGRPAFDISQEQLEYLS